MNTHKIWFLSRIMENYLLNYHLIPTRYDFIEKYENLSLNYHRISTLYPKDMILLRNVENHLIKYPQDMILLRNMENCLLIIIEYPPYAQKI